MNKRLYNAFMMKADEYLRKLDPVEDGDEIACVSSMREWVEDNADVLGCTTMDELFDEYEAMSSYTDKFNSDYYEEGPEDFLSFNENSEEELIKQFRSYCL